MTPLNDSTRRAFLAALGATGAAAAVVAAPGGEVRAAGEAEGFSDPNASPSATPALRTEAFPPPISGVTYKFIPGADFLPLDETTTYDKNFAQIETSGGALQAFIYSLGDLPPGSVITEITWAVIKSAGFPGAATYNVFTVVSGNVGNIGTANNSALPQQAAEQYVNIPIDTTNPAWTLDNQLASTLYISALLVNSRVNSVRLGYVPGPTTPLSFVPIAPKRAYDSRFVAPLGPLANNTNRVISVANSFVTGTGTVETNNIIPPTARAIAYNLTIANTVGSGFLSVNPGNALTPGGSSINWFQSGISLANGLVGSLDNNRQINVFCGGGGSTDFIVDINGYYL